MLRGHTTVHDTAGSGTWFPTRELFRKLDCVSPRQAPHLGLLGGSARAKALPEATLLVPQKVVQPHTLWAALGTPGAQAGLLPIPWEKGGCPCLVSLSHGHSSGGSSPKNRVIQRPSTYPHGSLWLRPCGRPSISFGGDSFLGKTNSCRA